MFSGIAFEKRILGHIIISHNVSWLRIKKWVMHVQFEQSHDRVVTPFSKCAIALFCKNCSFSAGGAVAPEDIIR